MSSSPRRIAAAQIAPALVQMGHAPDGAQRLTVRLEPPELGQVQVRIDRPPEAPARVEITVEKAETLTLLLRDQPQLQRALDQAGVPAEGRSVTFHVASPEPTARRASRRPRPAPGVAAGGLSGDGSHGASRQGGQSARQQSRRDGCRRYRDSRRSACRAGCASASTSPHDAKGNRPMSIASVAAQQNSASQQPRAGIDRGRRPAAPR